MNVDYCKVLLEDFIKNSWSTVTVLVERLKDLEPEGCDRTATFFRFASGRKENFKVEGKCFLRSSVEYSNPQLTVEELQGIIGARLLEVCANHLLKNGLREVDRVDIGELCEVLKKPPQGCVVPFLLNTDDVEPDRYSMNPLKHSIVESGQSAFPAAYVKTDQLKLDEAFMKKYDKSLISEAEGELITKNLHSSNGSYMDLVDSIKYQQIEEMSKFFGMDLSIGALRMPLSTLQAEEKDDLLHYIISESHRDYEAIEQAYSCMGRSMTKRTTLLTIPHSKKGFGSKRAARGKLHFEDGKLLDVTVKYKTTELYPNGVDPKDIAIAQADDSFTVEGEKLADYSFKETPSSPQFFLYSIGSPEDAALWHGVGAFASPQLLQSYSAARNACKEGKLIKNLGQKYNIEVQVPLQLNLAPEGMWGHPVHRNIDASVGSVGDLAYLASRGMRLEHLSVFK